LRRSTSFIAIALAASLAWPASASAHVAHTVQPGETLWSIAASSNFTTRALAAANGLPEDAQVQVGSTIQIPSEAEAAAALGGAVGAPVATSTGEAPPPLGAYTVVAGDTLSGIAAASGIRTEQLAWMNGLSPDDHVLAGTVLKLPTGAPPAAQGPAAQAPPVVVPQAEPHATPVQISASEVGEVAAAHGVSPSLAAAIAWQESGFNNGVVSPANARGVMQVLPGTWSWVEKNLADRRLDPNSAVDNVHAGVMYLGQLLNDAGGDETQAIASYYQGPASVRRMGLLPDTQRYVANVAALRSRFGG
jgi:N-acetylmuramoyl-L-alanine amidase